MKTINTNGLIDLCRFDKCNEWYWSTDYACGDLYEAEEIYRNGNEVKPPRLIYIHYPDGRVVEPFVMQANQYCSRPTYYEGKIYFLIVDFTEGMIRLYQYDPAQDELSTMAELPLSEVEDCYNLEVDYAPVMITRSSECHFQIVWPYRLDIEIGDTESFLYASSEALFFSKWYEDPEYREEYVVRDIHSGEILRSDFGSVWTMPDGQIWNLK